MKHILEIGIYRPGDLTSEVTSLDDVDTHVTETKATFTGHATVKSRFKGQDFSGFYQLSKVYLKRQERWLVVASRTARLGENRTQVPNAALERPSINSIPAAPRRIDLILKGMRKQHVKHIRKSQTKFVAAIVGLLVMAIVASRQFYLFVVFRNAQGLFDIQGGRYHLWLAVGATLMACIAGGLMFFSYLYHDGKEDDLSVT